MKEDGTTQRTRWILNASPVSAPVSFPHSRLRPDWWGGVGGDVSDLVREGR